jgi:TRAP-type C4-dicarboxylate transport system substrate-binding protein
MRGTIDLAHISTPEKYDSRVTIGFLPYLAKDYDELKKVFAADSYLTKEMTKIEAESDIKFLGYYCEGFSGVGVVDAVDEPSVPGVNKNSLVRVPSINAFKFPAERLGFSTSTIAYSDTFAAMQTGVVDGWVGGPPNLNYLTFRDVIKHYYQYNLTHESTQYLMNLEKFEGMTPEDQKIIEDAFREQCDASFAIAEQEDRKYLDLLSEQGIEVVEFTEEELASLAADVRANVWPMLTDKYPQELMDGIVESLK